MQMFTSGVDFGKGRGHKNFELAQTVVKKLMSGGEGGGLCCQNVHVMDGEQPEHVNE